MIYSCFNEKLGLYEYYQDDRGHPTNGDLPVPSIGAADAGKVGLPAMDAGRPLPAGATRAGKGWQARGMIVNCNNMSVRGLSGLGQDLGATAKDHPLVFAAVGILAMYGLFQVYVNAMQQPWGRR
jgi:hypothetical protein